MNDLTVDELKRCYMLAAQDVGIKGDVPPLYIDLAATCARYVLEQFCLKNALSLKDDK